MSGGEWRASCMLTPGAQEQPSSRDYCQSRRPVCLTSSPDPWGGVKAVSLLCDWLGGSAGPPSSSRSCPPSPSPAASCRSPPPASHAASLPRLHHTSSSTPGIWAGRGFSSPCQMYGRLYDTTPAYRRNPNLQFLLRWDLNSSRVVVVKKYQRSTFTTVCCFI